MNRKRCTSFVVHFSIIDQDGVGRRLKADIGGSAKHVKRFARKTLKERRSGANEAFIYTFDGHFVKKYANKK